jgi:hypothetical protein
MTALIDVIGATVAGAMVIMTILSTIFNVQRNNFNMNMILSMKTHSQKFISAFGQVYLENVGNHMESASFTGDIIHCAEPNLFSYMAAKRPYDPNPSAYIIQVIGSPSNYVIQVVEDGRIVYDSLPFFLKDNNIFTYKDGTGQTVAPTTDPTELRKIESCQVDISFTTFSHDTNPDAMLYYPTRFWHSFRNVQYNKIN